METVALVVAAGRGVRAGTAIPKQYSDLGGEPVLRRTLRGLLDNAEIGGCLVVINGTDRDHYQRCVLGLNDTRLMEPALGSDDRQGSVLNGLEALVTQAPRYVLIHDAARPFVSSQVVDRVLDRTIATGAAFAAMPVVDTLWREDNGAAAENVAREGLWRAQTPQGFRFDMILAAHRAAERGATDDVAIAKAAGHPAAMVIGDETNFKITVPADFGRAEKALER